MKTKSKKRFVPVTPGGSYCLHLVANSEAEAWELLLKDASHMPYKNKAEFQQRGYTVEEWFDDV